MILTKSCRFIVRFDPNALSDAEQALREEQIRAAYHGIQLPIQKTIKLGTETFSLVNNIGEPVQFPRFGKVLGWNRFEQISESAVQTPGAASRECEKCHQFRPFILWYKHIRGSWNRRQVPDGVYEKITLYICPKCRTVRRVTKKLRSPNPLL